MCGIGTFSHMKFPYNEMLTYEISIYEMFTYEISIYKMSTYGSVIYEVDVWNWNILIYETFMCDMSHHI